MNYRIEEKIAEIGIKICDFTYKEKGLGTILLKLLIKHLSHDKFVDKIILDTNLKTTRASMSMKKSDFIR